MRCSSWSSTAEVKALSSSKLKSRHTAPYVVEEEGRQKSSSRLLTGVKLADHRHLCGLCSLPSACCVVEHSRRPLFTGLRPIYTVPWNYRKSLNNKKAYLIKERYFKKFYIGQFCEVYFSYFCGLCEQLLLSLQMCLYLFSNDFYL